jgi:hypothetical protein
MRKILKTTTLLLLVIILPACSSEDIMIQKNNTSLLNPLEDVGIEHNKFVSKFMFNLEESHKRGDWSKIQFLSDDYKTQFSTVMNDSYHDIYPKSESTIDIQKKIYNDLNLNEWFDGDNYTGLDLAKKVLNEGVHSDIRKSKNVLKNKATPKDAEFTSNLLDDIYTASAMQYSSKKEAYEALEKVINKHEKLILSQKWKSEENYALGALAIGKHSTQFWKNYDFSVFKNNSKSVKSDKSSQAKQQGNPIIVAADIAGYVVGGVIGGALGITITIGSWSYGIVPGVMAFIYGKMARAFAASAFAASAIGIYEAWSDWLR